MPGRATQDGRVMVESSDRTWSAVEGNAKSLQYSYLENTMNSGGGGRCLVAKSCLTLAIPRTVACQAPLSMGFSRQEYWSGLPFPSPWYLPYPGIKPTSPALQADSLPLAPHGKPKVQTAKKMSRGQVMLPRSMDAGAGSTGRERTGCTDVFPKSILLLSVQSWRPAQSETTSV